MGPDEPTERAREVPAPVARGLSDAGLAATLHIPPPTAKTHVSGIPAKACARDRAHLVIPAHPAGIVAC